MKPLLAVFIILSLFVCCKTEPKDQSQDAIQKAISLGFTKRTIPLRNGFGIVSIYLPIKFDSSFRFIQRSDYDPCGSEVIYRFSSKKYTIDNDGNYAHLMKIDSLYQFTIMQLYDSGCNDNIVIDSTSVLRMETKVRAIDYRVAITGNHYQLREFNGLKYIFGIDNSIYHLGNDNKISFRVFADGARKREPLCFTFNFSGKDSTGFIKTAMTSFQTLKVDTTK
jgi:hypothetical protein